MFARRGLHLRRFAALGRWDVLPSGCAQVTTATRHASSNSTLGAALADPTAKQWRTVLFAAPAALALGVVAYSGLGSDTLVAVPEHEDDVGVLVNWSGTHDVQPRRLLQPTSLEELEGMVAEAHAKGEKLRCVGSGLSPNGIAFEAGGQVSLALMDRVLHVDKERMRVTVQAGARVQEVADELRKHGLSLQNYASIREQTVGGFTQVSAHGTGAGLPPVDETVVAMKLVTPAEGTLELDEAREPSLFRLARVGLGCLGVVAEVTLQCVAAHQLLEHTFTTDARTVRRNHARWLAEHQHLRYMWVPYTDTVVVVTNNPLREGATPPRPPRASEAHQLAPLRDLCRAAPALTSGRFPAMAEEELAVMSGSQLRDVLLNAAPVDVEWVKRVNKAEAEHWKRREGYRVGWSDELLGFDCGGQQWVLELSFPAGTRSRPDLTDLAFMDDLQRLITTQRIAAAPPLEQRWTAGSSAPMSPASNRPGAVGPPPDMALHSYVGIIMYLPEGDDEARAAVTSSFKEYAAAVTRDLVPKYGASEHWAKIELPEDLAERQAMIQRVRARYPTREFCAARARLDPHNTLGNAVVDALFPIPSTIPQST